MKRGEKSVTRKLICDLMALTEGCIFEVMISQFQ